MDQNFIKIFENKSGGVTIQYGQPMDDDSQSVSIDTIAFHVDDLLQISIELRNLSDHLSKD